MPFRHIPKVEARRRTAIAIGLAPATLITGTIFPPMLLFRPHQNEDVLATVS